MIVFIHLIINPINNKYLTWEKRSLSPRSSHSQCLPSTTQPTRTEPVPSRNGRENSESAGLQRNRPTEDSSSRRTSLPSKDTTLMPPKPTKKESINSLSTLMRNLPLYSLPQCHWLDIPKETINTKLSVPLIGPLKAKSQELRIKEDVDHAGLSQPQVYCNHGPWSQEKVALICQNNNLLTARDHKETKDATEDGQQLLLNTSQ